MLRKIDKNSINVREDMEITITQAKLPPLITHQCIGAIISIYQAWYRFSLIYFKIYYTSRRADSVMASFQMICHIPESDTF